MKRFTKISSMLLLLLITAWSAVIAQDKFPLEPPFDATTALKASDIVAGKKIALWEINMSVTARWYIEKQSRSNILTENNVFIVEDTEGQAGIVLKRYSDQKYLKSTNNTITWTDSKAEAVVLTAAHPGKNFSYEDAYLNPAPDWDEGYQTYLVRFTDANGNILNGNNASGFTNSTAIGSWSGFLVKEVNEEEIASPYPFTLSDAPDADGFAKNTTWYYLKLNNKYATYTEGENYISLNGKNLVKYGSFWAFVKNEDGTLKIYNAATGTSKVFGASKNPNTSGTSNPYFIEENTSGFTTTWDYVTVSGSTTNFCLNLTGETNKYPNDFSENGKIAFWNATVEGSRFTVEPVNLENEINTIKEYQKATAGAVGTLIGDDYAHFIAALEKNTVEGLVEALKIRDLTGQTVQLEPNKFYRLQNVYRTNDNGNTGKYMLGANAEGLCAEKMENTNASLLWKIEANAENESSVKLYHANAQKRANAIPTKNGGKGVTLSEDGAEYTMIKWSAAQYGFQIGDNYMVQFNDNLIGSWNEGGQGSDLAWYIMPAEDIKLNISDAGYATVNYPFAVQLPEDGSLKAYTGEIQEGTDGKVLLLTEVPGDKIPAETPVVLEGAQDTYTLTIDYENTEPSIPSDLAGTLLPKTIEENTTVYGLGYVNKVIGFYKMGDTDRTIGANKAYLPSSPVLQGVRGVTFSFGDNSGETTGIEDVTSNLAKEEYYDLQGRRVMNPIEGIYVTKSGKKVLFTK